MLLLWYLWPFVVEGDLFPLGPDAPVYLWWTRLAGLEGLSAVGSRPGIPALALVISGAFGLSVVQVTAALEVSLGVGLGLAAFALVRRSAGSVGAALAGLLAGTFGVHLAAGYIANLAMAVSFVAAIALLDRGRTRSAVIAALVFAGGGLAHPQFFLVGAVILLVSAAVAWRADRSEALRIAGATVGAGVVLGAGLLAAQIGPAPLDVDTSRDAFLRRAGLLSELRSAYFDRFVDRWTRYVQWISVPLAIVGFGSPDGTAGRVLRSWLVVTFVGIGLALATGWLPADRFVTFGFAVPILAALGIVRVWHRLRDRQALAVVVTAALTIAMLAGSAIAWVRQEPFLSVEELSAVSRASALLNDLDPGVPLAFVVHETLPTISFQATRAGNLIRAGVPPDRIRDVVVVVPPFAGAGEERLALQRLTVADLAEAERRTGRVATTIRLSPFDVSLEGNGVEVEIGDEQRAAVDTDGADPLEPSSPAGIAFGSVLTLRPARCRRVRVGEDRDRRRPLCRGCGSGGRSRTADRGRGWPRCGGRGDRRDRGGVRRASARRRRRVPRLGSSSSGAPERVRRHRSRSNQPSSAITTGVITQCPNRRFASYAASNRAGSEVHWDTVRASPVPISTIRGTRGSNQASGSAHVTYQGSRTGPSSIRQSNPHPQDAPTSGARISGARRTSVRPIRKSAPSSRTGSTIRGTNPSVSPDTASNTRWSSLEGASQPSWPASSSPPSVGSLAFRNGSAASRPSTTADPTCGASERTRCPRSARAATAIHHSSSGTAAVTLINAPSASAIVAHSSRPANTSAIADAIDSATRRSLWPLAALWNSTTGFSPTSAAAKASREGRWAAHRSRHDEERSEARRDRHDPEHRDLRSDRVHEPNHERRHLRPERSVDGGRVDPLRPDEGGERIERVLERGRDVRVRVIRRGDLAVVRVRVDVAREQERQQQQRDVVRDREPDHRSRRDRSAPALEEHQDERARGERDRDDPDGRERAAVERVEPHELRQRSDRAAGRRRQHRRERRPWAWPPRARRRRTRRSRRRSPDRVSDDGAPSPERKPREAEAAGTAPRDRGPSTGRRRTSCGRRPASCSTRRTLPHRAASPSRTA